MQLGLLVTSFPVKKRATNLVTCQHGPQKLSAKTMQTILADHSHLM